MLDALARGLRAAGGVLSPGVFQANTESDLLAQRAAQAEALQNKELAFKAAELADNRAFRSQEAEAARAARSAEVQARLEQTKSLAEQQLQFRRDQLDQNYQLGLQRLTDQKERDLWDRQYKERQQALDADAKRIMQGIAAQGLELRNQGLKIDLMRLGLEGDKRAEAQRRDLETRVTKFSEELQQNKVPALNSSMSAANDLLSKYEGKDIPGLGFITGSNKVPEWSRTSEAKDVRSALQGVSNDLLNLYSGLAVTLPEAERRSLEEMRNGNFDQVDFKNAWPRIVNRYNSVMGNIRAGVSDDVVGEYSKRPGAMKLDPIRPAFQKSGGPVQIKDDDDYNKLPSGAEFIGPDGVTRRKP